MYIITSFSNYNITKYVYNYTTLTCTESVIQGTLPGAVITNMFISCPFINGEYKFTDNVFYLSNTPYELTTSQECYLLTPKT